MIQTSIMDSDCGLLPKIKLNMILYIVSVVLTIIIIIITYHISLCNSSNKKTWDILFPIHNYLISDIIQEKKIVPITILCNLLAMFGICVLWSIFFIILYGIDREVPSFHNPTLYGFYLVSSLNYKQQHVSINTSRSIAFCNCASIIIILKRLLHIIYALHVGLLNIRIFLSLKSALLIMRKCYIKHNYIINKPWVIILLYEHIYYIMCISFAHCSYIERQLYVLNNGKTVPIHFITLTVNQHQVSRIHKSMKHIRYNMCTENRICVYMLLSLRMLYVVYVSHVVSPLTHPYYIFNMYTCIRSIFYGDLFYANAVALILKMSSYDLTYEYDCTVELYILRDIDNVQSIISILIIQA